MPNLSTSKVIPTSDQRQRSFATIVYPDSAPSDWQVLLQELKIPCAVSPLHDSDSNPDGSPKKPHYHVVFHFEGKKSVDQVSAITSTFGGVGVECVHSLRAYCRYLCHLDNPEKSSYKPSDVLVLGGLDYSGIIESAADRYAVIRAIVAFCVDNDVREFADLLEYAMFNNEAWFSALSDNCAYIIKEYIRSRRHRAIGGGSDE